MQTRRDFLRGSGQSLASASVWLAASASLIRSIESEAAASRWPDDDTAARDEVFWSTVARAFSGDGRYIVGSYVIERLRDAPGIQCFTDGDERRRGSLMRILVKGSSGEAVEKQLREKYGIWTFGRFGAEWDGIYISPNLFNLPSHLDHFIQALREIATGAGKT